MIQAQAIAHYLHRMRPDWDLTIMDAARELDDALMQKTFVDAWRVFLKMPSFLSTALFALEPLAPGLARALNRRSFRTAVPKAAAYLAAHRPDLIMSTHWACATPFLHGPGAVDAAPHPPVLLLRRAAGHVQHHQLRGRPLLHPEPAHRGRSRAPRCGPGAHAAGAGGRGPAHGVHRRAPGRPAPRTLGVPAENLVVVLSQGGEGIGRTLPFVGGLCP